MRKGLMAAAAIATVAGTGYYATLDGPVKTEAPEGVHVTSPQAAEPAPEGGLRSPLAAPAGGPRLSDSELVAAAVREGFTLEQIDDPRFGANRARAAIGNAQYRFGPDSPEGQAAIDEANRVSVLLTNARAARRRMGGR